VSEQQKTEFFTYFFISFSLLFYDHQISKIYFVVCTCVVGPGRRFESFSTLREIIKWGRIYHLISPEELIRHNNIVSKIEREGSAPGIPDEDIVVYEQPEEPEN
jgi:hypothetical protein